VSQATVATAATVERDVLDIVIIGAGLAGLTAARDLKRAGCDSFVVPEARDRVGGRTWNHDLGRGVISEAGGQWIGPGPTAIADLARELGIKTFDTWYRGKTVFLANDIRAAQDLQGVSATVQGMPTSSARWRAACPAAHPGRRRMRRSSTGSRSATGLRSKA
jgi:monoamine oxidase